MSQSVYPENKMKRKLRNGEIIMGMSTITGNTALVESMGYAGFDYLVIESEHSPNVLDERTLHIIRAAELGGLTPLMRVRDNDPSLIHKALDLGCQGIFCVHVESKNDAERLVDAVKYPPLGSRSAGPGRYLGKHRYAINTKNYPDYWNKNSIVMFLIESKKGVDNLEEIVTVPGIDVIGIGQGDLSLDLRNWVGRFQHPDCVKAVEKLLRLSEPKGIAVRDIFSDLETAQKWHKKGVSVFEWGNDLNNFLVRAKEIISFASKIKS